MFRHIVLLFEVISVLALSSCRTGEQAFRSYSGQSARTDTVRIFTLSHDTLRLKDSVHVREVLRGDTVRIEEHHYHNTQRILVRRDTVYAARRDTVRVAERSEVKAAPARIPFFSFWTGAAVAACIAAAIYISKKFRHG